MAHSIGNFFSYVPVTGHFLFLHGMLARESNSAPNIAQEVQELRPEAQPLLRDAQQLGQEVRQMSRDVQQISTALNHTRRYLDARNNNETAIDVENYHTLAIDTLTLACSTSENSREEERKSALDNSREAEHKSALDNSREAERKSALENAQREQELKKAIESRKIELYSKHIICNLLTLITLVAGVALQVFPPNAIVVTSFVGAALLLGATCKFLNDIPKEYRC